MTCGRPRSPRARSGGSPAGCSTGGCWPTTRASTWWSTASLRPGPARTAATASPATGATRSRCRTRTCGCCARTPPGCTRPPLRWAGGGRSPGQASSARGTSRRSASSSGLAASACSCSGQAWTGEPPTWGLTARSPARPGRSSRSRGPPPRRRSCRRGSLARCLAPRRNQTRTLSRKLPRRRPAPEPEPATAAAPGTSLAPRRQPVLTPAPQPTGPRAISPVPVPSQEWGVKPRNPSYVGPKTPTDVKIVVGALVVAAIVAAIIIGDAGHRACSSP